MWKKNKNSDVQCFCKRGQQNTWHAYFFLFLKINKYIFKKAMKASHLFNRSRVAEKKCAKMIWTATCLKAKRLLLLLTSSSNYDSLFKHWIFCSFPLLGPHYRPRKTELECLSVSMWGEADWQTGVDNIKLSDEKMGVTGGGVVSICRSA